MTAINDRDTLSAIKGMGVNPGSNRATAIPGTRFHAREYGWSAPEEENMKEKKPELIVAIAGCGTVGSAVAVMLTQQQEILQSRTDASLVLRYIVDVDFSRARECGLDPALYCEDYDKVLKDDEVGVIIELIGGIGTARDFIERALKAGKHVVTANKALLAHDGADLMALARRNGLCIKYEASCAGGIPIIRSITDGLIANRIFALYGILNGTCNYILTSMTRQGKSYQEALNEAKDAGFAEADPGLDVSGIDTAHKLAILASLAFGERVRLDNIPVAGIDQLEALDVAYGLELGYIMKLLAIAKRYDSGLSLCVRPAFISKDHPLAWVSGPFNAVSVYGHATGHTLYYGRGAGGAPTASAVVSDLNSIAAGTAQKAFTYFQSPDKAIEAKQLALEEIHSRYYLRIVCEDSPGVLSQIASRLGGNSISISSVLQKEPPVGSDASHGVPVVITTHNAVEGDMRAAIEEINTLSVVKKSCVCIDIVDEAPESLTIDPKKSNMIV